MEESKKLDNENLSEIDQKKDYIKRLDNNISTVMSQRKIAEEGIELVSNMQQRLKKAFASIEEGVTDPKSIQVYESLKNEANILYKPTFEGLEMIYSCDCNVEIRAKGILSLTNLGQKLLDICLL